MKLYFKILVIVLIQGILVNFSNAQWVQMGNDIIGEANGDWSGYDNCLSSSGSIIAIGAPLNNGTGIDQGHVRVYGFNSGDWIRIGNDINGDFANENFGYSVSLSSDGSILAIGAPYSNVNGTSSGSARVYEFIGGDWFQIGSDLYGDTTDNFFGLSVCLNSNGSIIAIGAPCSDSFGIDTSSGFVRIYENIGGNWIQIGNDIYGEASNDNAGKSVSLNSNGNVIAIGANWNDGNGAQSGHVRVFEYLGGAWIQLGNDIDGESSSDESGFSVSLNSDGTRLAIGEFRSNDNYTWAGQVRVFEFDGSNWIQVGDDINGESSMDNFGCSVSLDSIGNTLATGAWWNNGNGSDAGQLRVYKYYGSIWNQIGSDLDGNAADDRMGCSVSINSDGTTVSAGAPCNNFTVGTGYVKVYNLTNDINENPLDANIHIYPNPTNGLFIIELDDYENIEILNNMGQTIIESHENNINICNHPNGIYFYRIICRKNTITGILIKE